ncbi:hypothetical protein EBR77_02895 [bacterium]|nr:hypothetical protein [bacterium]NBX78699.1 hypothetical protein [bacterium]
MIKKNFIIYSTLALIAHSTQAIAPYGFLQPYNFVIQPDIQDKTVQIIGLFEQAFNTRSYDVDGNLVNPLQMYESKQDALALFQGFDTDSQFAQLLNSFAMGPGSSLSADAGLYSVTGDVKARAEAIGLSWKISHGFSVRAYLPLYQIELKNVDWIYSGGVDDIFSDAVMQQELLSSFAQDAKNLFDLSIDGWKVSGVGDLALMVQWQANFPQYRKALNNVQPRIRFGIEIPTGKKVNENVIAMPAFGNDGALAFPFGAELNLQAFRHLEFKVNAQFWYILGNTKNRRIKSFENQTTLLLPSVVSAYKEHGFVQNFNLGLKINLTHGLFARALYDYERKSEDIIFVSKNGALSSIVATQKSLDETTHHYAMLSVGFDGAMYERLTTKPQIHFFVRIPFNGSAATCASTVGAQLSLEF